VRVVLREIADYVEFAVSFAPGRLGVTLRTAWFRRRLRALGARASFGIGLQVSGGAAIVIGDDFGCGRFCVLTAGGGGAITVGHRVNLNSNVSLNAAVRGRIELSDDIIIGPNTVLRASDHVTTDRERPIRTQGHTGGVITVGRDVWLGANVTVAGGVRVGQGAVVAAGAVVVADVEPYTIVGGVPARFIKKRGE
jgi:acetyltransferase-like isoleucine patch superfamily enzyme